MHPLTRRARRLLAGTAIAAAVLAGTLGPAAADAPDQQSRPPAFTLSGTGTWSIRQYINDAVVNGTGQLQQGSPRHATDVLVAAVVDADDGTLPGPGECEGAITTMSAYGVRGVDFTMIGAGEVCGLYVQAPTSIVTHVFTGTFEVYDAVNGSKALLGTEGFFEVRLADNGTASVFAIDT